MNWIKFFLFGFLALLILTLSYFLYFNKELLEYLEKMGGLFLGVSALLFTFITYQKEQRIRKKEEREKEEKIDPIRSYILFILEEIRNKYLFTVKHLKLTYEWEKNELEDYIQEREDRHIPSLKRNHDIEKSLEILLPYFQKINSTLSKKSLINPLGWKKVQEVMKYIEKKEFSKIEKINQELEETIINTIKKIDNKKTRIDWNEETISKIFLYSFCISITFSINDYYKFSYPKKYFFISEIRKNPLLASNYEKNTFYSHTLTDFSEHLKNASDPFELFKFTEAIQSCIKNFYEDWNLKRKKKEENFTVEELQNLFFSLNPKNFNRHPETKERRDIQDSWNSLKGTSFEEQREKELLSASLSYSLFKKQESEPFYFEKLKEYPLDQKDLGKILNILNRLGIGTFKLKNNQFSLERNKFYTQEQIEKFILAVENKKYDYLIERENE